jgi:hypothetical protein
MDKSNPSGKKYNRIPQEFGCTFCIDLRGALKRLAL